MELLIRLGDIAIWGGALSGLLFIFYYHLTARWWKSEAGWHLMTWTVVTDAIIDYVAFATYTRKVPLVIPTAQAWSRLIIFGAFWFLLVWRLSFVYRSQHKARVAHGVLPSAIPPLSPDSVPPRRLDERGTWDTPPPEDSPWPYTGPGKS